MWWSCTQRLQSGLCSGLWCICPVSWSMQSVGGCLETWPETSGSKGWCSDTTAFNLHRLTGNGGWVWKLIRDRSADVSLAVSLLEDSDVHISFLFMRLIFFEHAEVKWGAVGCAVWNQGGVYEGIHPCNLRTVLSVKTKCVIVFSLRFIVMTILSYNCVREDSGSWLCAFLRLFALTRLAGLLALAIIFWQKKIHCFRLDLHEARNVLANNFVLFFFNGSFYSFFCWPVLLSEHRSFCTEAASSVDSVLESDFHLIYSNA